MKLSTTSLRKQQEGMGHVLMVVLILVVLGVIGFAGYTVANKSKPKASTTTTTTSNKTEASAVSAGCLATYHDANLCHAASHANLDKVAYTATLTTSGGESGDGSMTLKSDGKGNTALSGTGNGATFNSIELDGATYIQNGSVWYSYPAAPKGSSSSSSDATPDPTANMNLVLGAGITYKPLGTEACGSLTCYKYQISDTAMPNATQFAWFDTHDYLLREWKYTDGTNGTTDMTINYQSVTISKPSPVQPIQ